MNFFDCCSARFCNDGCNAEAGAEIEAITELSAGHKLATFFATRNQSASAIARCQGIQLTRYCG